ncbi:MAG: 16S rRNA processing protein RimM [Thermoproteota archaeon]|jgi:16S rRNA processing protein RimM
MGTSDKDWIELGSCEKPHGIKGGFSFYLFNQDESILKKGFEVFLKPAKPSSSIEESGLLIKIKSIQFGNKTICYLENITDRNNVEAMIPFKILVDREDFPSPAEDEFYIADLKGAKVIDLATNKEVGIIKGFSDNGQQMIICIAGLVNIDLPYVDHFFPKVDIEKLIIYVNLPEVED